MVMVIQDHEAAEDLQQLFQWHSGGDFNAVQAEFDPETGKNVVFLQDIQVAYPGTFFIKDAIKVVPYLKDKSRKHLEPLRMEYLPNKVLKVVPIERPVVEYFASDSTTLDIVSPSNPTTLNPTADSATQPLQVSMNGQLLVDIVHRVEEVIDTQHRNHAEMVDMTKTTHNWLALILDRANAIFRLTYELHEYPIPRLFVILPGRNSFKNRLNPLVDKYRLYFLCECDLSASGGGNRGHPHIHFAKHDGYDLERPTEFFKKYGSYILTLLQLLRFSVAAASFAVPHIAGIGKGLEKGIEEVESAAKDQLKQKVDEAIGFLKDLPTRDQVETGNDMDAQGYDIEKVEALEGADLRHLASFLKNRDETQVLGNLYRLARPDGTIKWVCLDHYREEYKAIDRQHFMEFVHANNGTYYPNEGKVEMRLISRQMATQFYQQLIRARFVHDLVLTLDWYTTLDDFKDLRSVMVSLPTILSLTVDCCNAQSRVRDFATRGTPSSILNKVMAGHGLQTFSIKNCNEFLNQVEKLNLSNQLRRIDLGAGIEGRAQVHLISSLVKKSPRLRHLTVQLPDLPSVLQLYDKPDKYHFKGASVLEAQVDTGESLTAEIRGNTFGNISLLAMDCTKDISAFSFVTNLATAINAPSDVDRLGQFLTKAKGLKEIIVRVEASLFFEIRQLIIQRGKNIGPAYFHDKNKDNILIMADIRDPATAEVDLLDDSADFERLLTHFGAAPRSCGKHVTLTNEIFAKLEVNTRRLSRISFIEVDISILDDKGVENAISVIQRSALAELSICASAPNKAPLMETSLLWNLIKEVVPCLKETILRVQCPEGQICQCYKFIRSLVSADMNGSLELSDGSSTISLDDIQDAKSANVLMNSDNLGMSLEDFYEMFGCLPSVLGVDTPISESVIPFLEKTIQPEDKTLKRLTFDPCVLSHGARDLALDLIRRCSLDSLDVHYHEDAVDLIIQVTHILGDGELTVRCSTESIPTIQESLRLVWRSNGVSRSLRITDGSSTIIFDNVFRRFYRLISKGDTTTTASKGLFDIDITLQTTQGYLTAITPAAAASMEQWTRSFPSPYTKIWVDTSKLDTSGILDMAQVISRSKMSSLTFLCSKVDKAEKDKRKQLLSDVLPHLPNSELYIHCPVKEFPEMWQLLKAHKSPHQRDWEHHLCDGERRFVILPNAAPKLVIRGRAVHYEDTPPNTEDELGDTMLHLGSYVEQLDMEDIAFSDKDAAQWLKSISNLFELPRLTNLRLSTAHLTYEGLNHLQHVLEQIYFSYSPDSLDFAFICECNQQIPTTVSELLERYRSILCELTLRGPEVQKWIHSLSVVLPDRYSLPRMSSLQVISNGEHLDTVSSSWIFSMTQTDVGLPGLKRIHLGDVRQSSISWTLFFQCLEKKSLEELDLSGTNVSYFDILAAGYALQAPLKTLNLKRTNANQSVLPIFRSIADGRLLEILLDPPELGLFDKIIKSIANGNEQNPPRKDQHKNDIGSDHEKPPVNPTWAPKLRTMALPPQMPSCEKVSVNSTRSSPSPPMTDLLTSTTATATATTIITTARAAPALDMAYISPPSMAYLPPPSERTASVSLATQQDDSSVLSLPNPSIGRFPLPPTCP